jgi:hypothetical protein
MAPWVAVPTVPRWDKGGTPVPVDFCEKHVVGHVGHPMYVPWDTYPQGRSKIPVFSHFLEMWDKWDTWNGWDRWDTWDNRTC